MTLFKELRLEKGLTQQQMADELDIKLRTYRSYELGEKMPKYKTLAKFLMLRGKEEDKKLADILHNLINEGWYDGSNI